MWLPPVTTVPPAEKPVSRDQAKEFLRIDAGDSSLDAQVDLFVAAARERVERETATRLITQKVELRASDFDDLAQLPIGPVESIDAVTYLDMSGAEQPLDGFDVIRCDLACGLQLRPGRRWPVTYLAQGVIRVQATVGYGLATAVPPSVAIAILLVVRALMDDRPVDVSGWLVNHRLWL